MSRNDESVELTYDEQVAETPMALLLRFDDAKVWIPKSQIECHDNTKREITIPEWLAVAKELA